jgi:hypothetical protein
MADPRTTPKDLGSGTLLPALERIAPIPDLGALTAQVAARSKPGDVVLELHGRGGWVTRAAIDQLRRAFTIETTAITRLVADIVLRPPDLRHLDAAVSAIAVDSRGMEGGLRAAIEATYATRCPGCGGTVVVDEFIWDAEGSDPSRRTFRCPRCRDVRSDRPMAVDPDDVYRSRSIDAAGAREELLERFPAPSAGHPLPAQLVDLFPPRAQLAIAAILERIETEPRAPAVQSALRLALVHMLLPSSRLNGYPGRLAAVRISGGQVRGSSSRQWRERNAWTAFEDGTRAVRAFVQALDAGGQRTPARVGADLRALLDGSANVALRFGTPVGRETFGPPPRPGVQPGARPRVPPSISLVLSQPPIHWSPDNLAFAYLASALAIGPEAAATLPLAGIFGAPPRSEWGRDAATLQRALTAIRPVLLPDAQVVLLLTRADTEALVAAVIGAVGAGLRFDDAVLTMAESGLSGTVVFAPPRSSLPSGRDVAIRSASDQSGPFQISAVEAAIADIAVAVMQLRGEPTRFDRILGEVLLGLDHLGHLRRLVGTPSPALDDEEDGEAAARPPAFVGLVSDVPAGIRTPQVEAAVAGTVASTGTATPGEGTVAPGGPEQVPLFAAEEHVATSAAVVAAPAPAPGEASLGAEDGPPTRTPDAPGAETTAWRDDAPAADPVRLTLDLIRREMKRPDHPRLAEIEEALWWLRDPRDLAAAKAPLAERVEWGIFSLLTTSGGISQASFDERIGRLFRGPETADPEIVQACLASYRSAEPSPDGLIRTDESLPRRYAEHGEMVGMLSDFAHRLGMRVWITRREQRRTYQGQALAELLSDPERRVYLPLVAPGPQEVLEEVDCIWYVRGKGAFLFDVEWMAVFDEPVLRRGPHIETSDAIVRFLVLPDERVPLARLRLERSPVLRGRLEEDNWHILRWSSVRRLHAGRRASLASLAPLLGLDPQAGSSEDQMPLFGG